jgi:hypothetical protein
MDNNPHVLLTLANPIVIGGPIATRWPADLQIPTPSMFLPSMTVIHPRSHTSSEQGQGRAPSHHGDAGGTSSSHHHGDDDDGDRRKSKRSKKDKHDRKKEKRQRREGHSGSGVGDAGDDGGSSSSSDCDPNVRKFTDPAGNEVLNSKSKVTMTVRRSQPYRAFTTQDMRDATFF